MPVLLGIDTGGTYTDAVLVDDATNEVLASAKALTSHHNLVEGILAAATAVVSEAGTSPSDIALVGLSTTLATNALTEGRGGRVGLISVGFDESTLARGGLLRALDGGPSLLTTGGHKADGTQLADLDLDHLSEFVNDTDDSVDAYAVVAEFSVRNPSHEQAVREHIEQLSQRPVSVSHELSPRLGGPQRGVTTILNARLIALVDELLAAVRSSLVTLGVSAPLVIVRGDGSLLSDTATRHAPIETILSGPAASVVGAAHLVGQQTALVADIGGTTTDVAIMRDGRPRLNPAGATVGGHLTMVQAVDVTTIGLGGDSTVSPRTQGSRRGQLHAGPGRVLPISLLALDHPDFVRSTIRRQTEHTNRRESFAQFIVPTGRTATRTLSRVEQDVLDALDGKPAAADQFVDSGARSLGIDKLAQAGFVRRAGFTPTDAAHILGVQNDFDGEAAALAAALLVQVWNGLGYGPWDDTNHLARDAMSAVTRQSAELFLDVCLAGDGLGGHESSAKPIMAAALDGTVGLTAPSIKITLPVVGLGASAATYHAGVGPLLGTEILVPDHAGVANAVGAVVGQVRTSLEARITQPHRGTYAIHGVPDNARFQDLEEARKFLETTLVGLVAAKAQVDGAVDAEVSINWQDKMVTVGDKPYLVEGHLTVEAIGRPRLADPAV